MSRRAWSSIAAEAVIWSALLASMLLVAQQCAGCGGASPEVRSAYAIEQARCLANERAIIDRAGTGYEEDRADLAAERARCDLALRSIAP